jgi:ketosteroid isomerase-like protein
VILSALLAALAAGAPLAAQQDTSLASLVAAELAFAAQSEREGIRSAFISHLAPGAVMFAPDPVDGHALYRDAPPSEARLAWYPSHAGVSSTGDLGFTTGPYEYRAAPPDSSVGYGHFASVWRRGADGVWKVEVDLGAGHPKPGRSIAVLDAGKAPVSAHRYEAVGPLTPTGVEQVRTSLVSLDSAFARTAAARGTAEALDQFAADAIRLQRPGEFPVTGRRRAVRMVAREPGTPRWEPLGGGASTSGELGYTWGAVRWGAETEPRGHYLRVWRRTSDGWRVALDIVAPRER